MSVEEPVDPHVWVDPGCEENILTVKVHVHILLDINK